MGYNCLSMAKQTMASPGDTTGVGALARSTSGNTSDHDEPASESAVSTLPDINTAASPPSVSFPKDDKSTSSSSSSSYYSALWSPKKLMQRASRAFRGSGRSRRKSKKNRADGGGGGGPTSVASKSVRSLEDVIADEDLRSAAANNDHPEIVPAEKIIHEANPSVAVAVNHQEEAERAETPEKEKTAAAAPAPVVVVEEEDPKKGAPPAPAAVDGGVTDVFMVTKAIEEEEEPSKMKKEEAVVRFEGSRVKTAMEKRSEEEQPQRREVARSNDVIEETRSKLLERRCSKVRALVGAFETVMDTSHPAAGKPQTHHLRKMTI